MTYNKTHKRILTTVLAALLIFSSVFSTSAAAYKNEIGKLEEEKEIIKQDKIDAGNKVASLREQKATWVELKAALDEENRLTQEEILNLKDQIETLDLSIAEKELEAKAAQTSADDALHVYKKHLRSLEESGQFSTYLHILLGAGDFTEVLSRVDTLSEIMDYDKRIEENYKLTRDAALAAKEEYEQLNTELKEKKEEKEEEITRLEKDLNEAIEKIETLQKEIEKYEAIYNAALQREYAVQNSLNTIIAQMKAAEEAAKQPPISTPDDTTNENPDNNTSNTVQPPDTSTVTGSYTWPLPSSRLVTSPFGNRIHPEYGTMKFHKGIDINAAMGASIVAADGGTVITVSNDPAGYGIYVAIYHSGGRSTLYAHMNAAAVSAGQTVTKGQVIGYAGSSGVSTGPHLHFEISENGSLHDPLGYFSGYTIQR